MQRRAERENLKGIRGGRREAYEKVICQNYKSIYRFMAYLTGDRNTAEDLTQETFTSAWANIDNYKGQASLGTWLHKIAYHKLVDSRRALDHRAGVVDRLRQESRDGPESLSPLQQAAADEHRRLVCEAMGNLDSLDYIVIVLHYVQGLSLREVAKVLDKPVGTVKWRTSQALKRLKAFLTGRG